MHKKDLEALRRTGYSWAQNRLRKIDKSLTPIPTEGEARERARDEYVAADVAPLKTLDEALVKFSAIDRASFESGLAMNYAGLPLDTKLCAKIASLGGRLTEEANERMQECTGLNATQREKVRSELAKLGVEIPNMQAATLEDIDPFRSRNPELVQKVIDAYIDAGAKAHHKFASALAMANDIDADGIGRIRGCLRHAQAHTRRDTTKIVNTQNFKKADFGREFQEALADYVVAHADSSIIAATTLTMGTTAQTLKSLERSMIIAPTGAYVAVGDFSKAEPMSLYFITGERDSDTPYHDIGAAMLNKARENGVAFEKIHALVGEGDLLNELRDDRTYFVVSEDILKTMNVYALSKKADLGIGYGQGLNGFHATCRESGIDVDRDIAEMIHNQATEAKKERFSFAARVEVAMRYALQGYKTGFYDDLVFVQPYKYGVEILLPSGGAVRYRNLKADAFQSYGGTRYQIEYYPGFEWSRPKNKGTNPKKLAVGIHKGTILENVGSSMARDFLFDAINRSIDDGLEVVAQVHDEIIAVVDGEQEAARMQSIMNTAPSWSRGFAMKAEVELLRRYSK